MAAMSECFFARTFDSLLQLHAIQVDISYHTLLVAEKMRFNGKMPLTQKTAVQVLASGVHEFIQFIAHLLSSHNLAEALPHSN
jgi:hypothetical protein